MSRDYCFCQITIAQGGSGDRKRLKTSLNLLQFKDK